MSIAVAAIPSPYIHSSQKRRKNTWYSIKDGNWDDPNTWMSNSLAYAQNNFNYPSQAIPNPIFPQVGDDVYINHTVTLNVGSTLTPIQINNLYISGILKSISGTFIYVRGNLQGTGQVDYTGSTGTIYLFGPYNYIVSFIKGSSTIIYVRYGDQDIMQLDYFNLKTELTPYFGSRAYLDPQFGTKYLYGAGTVVSNIFEAKTDTVQVGDMTFDNNFTSIFYGMYDSAQYNTTVNGSVMATSSAFALWRKSGPGNILIKGAFNISSVSGFRGNIDFSGNPNVELRGGMITGYTNNIMYLGTGTWTFTTNNQTISLYSVYRTANKEANFNNVVVQGAITVTNTTSSTNNPVISGSLNGTAVNSTFVNAGNLYFYTSVLPMITGIFDITTNANKIGYVQPSDYTLPYSTYSSLTIGGYNVIGTTKTINQNTLINDSLTIMESTNLECGIYNLTITGIFVLSDGTLKKSGAGNIIFNGYVNGSSVVGIRSNMDFSGNPSVEVRNGIYLSLLSNGTFIPGTGTWTFSTNNQLWDIQIAESATITGISNLLISGAITVYTGTFYGVGISNVVNNSLNGNNAASKFENKNKTTYRGSAQPMITGLLECNSTGNTFVYDKNGNQDIKGTTYRILEFGGSGVKTLQGNVIVNVTAGGSWSITGTATIDYNGFTITSI